MLGLVLGVLVSACGDRDGGRAVLSCPRAEHDFGSLSNATELVHNFQVRNTGDRDVRVLCVRVSCGCTEATVSPELVRAGESARVRVRLDTTGRYGRLHYTVSLSESDATPRLAELTVLAEVHRDVELHPPAAQLGVVGDQWLYEQNVAIRSGTGRQLRLLNVRMPTNSCVVAESSSDSDGLRIRLSVPEQARRPGARFLGDCIVRVDSGESRDVVLPVYVYLPPTILVSPANVMLQADGKPWTRSIFVRSPWGIPFSINGVSTPSGISHQIRGSGDFPGPIVFKGSGVDPAWRGRPLRIDVGTRGADTNAVLYVPILISP